MLAISTKVPAQQDLIARKFSLTVRFVDPACTRTIILSGEVQLCECLHVVPERHVYHTHRNGKKDLGARRENIPPVYIFMEGLAYILWIVDGDYPL